jgi:hypothetical protein
VALAKPHSEVTLNVTSTDSPALTLKLDELLEMTGTAQGVGAGPSSSPQDDITSTNANASIRFSKFFKEFFMFLIRLYLMGQNCHQIIKNTLRLC